MNSSVLRDFLDVVDFKQGGLWSNGNFLFPKWTTAFGNESVYVFIVNNKICHMYVISA